MEEIEMLKLLGAELDGQQQDGTKLRVRGVLEREVSDIGQDRQSSRRPGRRGRILIIAAAMTLASLGGIAAAGGFSDGLGVDDPPGPKIPYVQVHIDQVEAELATLDASTPEGKARAEFLDQELAALRQALARLCEEAGQPEGC